MVSLPYAIIRILIKVSAKVFYKMNKLMFKMFSILVRNETKDGYLRNISVFVPLVARPFLSDYRLLKQSLFTGVHNFIFLEMSPCMRITTIISLFEVWREQK